MSPSDFDFVNDIHLRRKIVDSIDVIAVLYFNIENSKQSKLIVKELRRMVILYIASIIEALLLYLYRAGEYSIDKQEYVFVQSLDQNLDPSQTLVIAKRKNLPRKDRELMLDILLAFFNDQGLVTVDLKKRIDIVRNIRNTFHLAKSRKNILCGNKTIILATQTLFETATVVKQSL